MPEAENLVLSSSEPALATLVRRLSRQHPLSTLEVEALLSLPHRQTSANPGAYIVREGDRPANCCALLSGFAFRQKSGADGRRQILSIQMQGDMIDLESGLFIETDHSIQTLTKAEVAYIPHRAISDLAANHSNIARALWMTTLVDGAQAREWIMNIGRRSARARIAHLICELALRQEAAGLADGFTYAWPMTQEQIGDATGLTAVHVNRMLQALLADKLISISGRSFKILNWAELQTAGDFKRAYLHNERCEAI